MLDEKTTQSYICSSSDWDCLVEAAFSPNEAAAIAMQRQVNSDSQVFSVGTYIAVIPVILDKREMKKIYSPSVLADIGLHKYADDLSRNLEKTIEETNKTSNKKSGDEPKS
jgi:hypothetical protein